MFWRKFKLDWSYAIGELIIVTAGVLIALAIGQWNSNRLDQKAEKVVISQWIADLQTSDLKNLGRSIERLKDKEASLIRLEAVFARGGPVEDKVQFLHDIVIGANFGWNQGRPKRTTYDKIISSGKFGLIRNAELSARLSDYYLEWIEYISRADERETEFPSVSYRLVPRRPSTASDGESLLPGELEGSQAGILLFDSETPKDKIDLLVANALDSALREHIVAELNFGRFVQVMMADLHADATALVDELTEYGDSL